MKKILSPLLSFVACVLCVVCLVQIDGLKKQLAALDGTMGSVSIQMQNLSNGLYADIHSALEEQQSNILSYDMSYSSPDLKTKTVPVTYSVTPKTYDPQKTEVTFFLDGKQYPASLKDEQFEAEFSVPLFPDKTDTLPLSVAFSTDGVRQMEQLDPIWISPSEVLGSVSPFFDGKMSVDKDQTAVLWTGTVTLSVDVPVTMAPNTFVQKIECLTIEDEEVVSRKEIAPEDWRTPDASPDTPATAVGTDIMSGTATPDGSLDFDLVISLQDSAPLRKDATSFILAFDVTTASGVVFRTVLHDLSLTAQPADSRETQDRSACDIYDTDGHLLFSRM